MASRPLQVALEVGAEHGFSARDPVVLQDTNNHVVWLRPHPVVAKVGTMAHSAEVLRREHELCRFIAEHGGPVAAPTRGIEPICHAATGYTVTLWEQLEPEPDRELDAVAVGESLRLLHAHLARSTVELPSYRWGLSRAEAVLNDDAAMRHLDDEGIAVLRGAFELLTDGLDAEARPQQTLHGEPHTGNLLLTAQGPRWVDLEAACVGPLEWDLASLPSAATVAFDDLDHDLLARLRVLNRARVATWCWARADLVGMRWHAQHHLQHVRAWRHDTL